MNLVSKKPSKSNFDYSDFYKTFTATSTNSNTLFNQNGNQRTNFTVKRFIGIMVDQPNKFDFFVPY
ncbi:22258_t:CDS:2 [Cetraspora pellucida]|uniref:22258_t:CDS:1 n=1 Tax=Cetraspora pellucida TaxID=1433469 RepID=A0A9N9AAE8_9GLOM|nr:22258_t:CDS:2 [Cetraspora pellucida]